MIKDPARELERRFRETGSIDDEAAWLVELLRSGGLPAERLALAAWLEHPAARRISEPTLLIPFEEDQVDEEWSARLLDPWLEGLCERSPEAGRRAACALAAWAFDWLEPFRDEPLLAGFDLAAANRAIDLIERVGLGDLAQPEDPTIIDAIPDRRGPPPDENVGRAERAFDAIDGALHAVCREPVFGGDSATWLCMAASNALFTWHWERGEAPLDSEGWRAVSTREAAVVVREELVPWLLGTGDPLRDRVNARHRRAPR